MTAEHQCEPWQLLERDEGGYYCGACGKNQPQPPVKSAADVWNEAVEAVAQHLETGVVHYTWNGNARRPSNYRAAAADARTTPNPYGDKGIPARESEEWKALVVSAENLGRAVAEFQNAKDDYTTLYPKDSSAHQ